MSMDGVGTMKACTSVVVLNSRIRISSVHSWTKFLTFSAYRFMGTLLDRIAVDEHETSAPTRLGEHMLRQIDNVVQADRGGIELIRGSVKGPVNDERLANNVLARDESPSSGCRARNHGCRPSQSTSRGGPPRLRSPHGSEACPWLAGRRKHSARPGNCRGTNRCNPTYDTRTAHPDERRSGTPAC